MQRVPVRVVGGARVVHLHGSTPYATAAIAYRYKRCPHVYSASMTN